MAKLLSGRIRTLNVGVVSSTESSTSLNVIGDVKISGIVTSTFLSLGGQTVSSVGVGIATAGGIIGIGATLLDFRGSGISSVTVSSGIATINIVSGGGGATSSYTETSFTATEGQTTFAITYEVGYVEIYLNGIRLSPS